MSQLTRNRPAGNTIAFLTKDKSDAGRSKQGALKAKEYLQNLKQEIENRKRLQLQRTNQLNTLEASPARVQEPRTQERGYHSTSFKKQRVEEVKREQLMSSSSDEEEVDRNQERTEEEIETVSDKESDLSSERVKRKGKLKQDKFGRYHIRFKDQHSKKIYHIEAPNNVFFNDDIAITRDRPKKKPPQRGRRQEPEVSDYRHMVPTIKRNMTPDDTLSRTTPEGYLLVDGQGKPRKILIQRKNAIS